MKFKAIFALTVSTLLSIFSQSSAATLTWDANGATALRTDGLGVWLTANQWWNGSSNVTWTSGDDAVFGNGGTGGAVTLDSPTTVNSLTFNSFTGTYTLGTAGQTITLNNGITMNSGAGAATIISPITLGAAQSWTNNSASLLTIGTGAVTNAGYLLTIGGTGNTTVSSAIGGSGGLTKNGAGTLTLSGTNTYTGGTVINAGRVSINAAGQLPTAGPLTFAGSGTVSLNDAALTLPQTIINAGAVATFDGGAAGGTPTTTMGAVSGGGTFNYTNAGGGGKTVTFSGGLANFTGVLQYSGAAGAIYNVPSLADSAGRIRYINHGLTLNYTGTSPLVLNNRQIELAGHGNLAFNASGLLTINTDLLVTAAGNKNLALSGPSTGTNAFNGTIGNGVGAAISLTLTNGIWSIAGTNTYTGATNVQAGTVIVNSLKDYGVASPFGLGTSGTAIGLGQSVSSATLIYTGTGDTSNRTFDLMQGASNNGNAIKQILNNGSGALILTAAAFNVNQVTAPHNLKTIQLGGTYSGSANEIQGVIQNLISGAGSPLIKAADPSIWKLSGANTYTGGTTVSGGTLVGAQTSGSPFSTGAVTLNAGTLSLAPGGTGSNVAVTGGTLAAGTLFSFNPGATLSLNKGSQTSLTYTFGGTGAAYSRGTNGTLILSTSDIANFGNAGSKTERFIINGTAPTAVNTVVSGVVIQDRNTSNSPGDFAAYNATDGFIKATYTKTDSFTSSANSDLVNITTGISTPTTTTLAYALKVGAATVTNTGTITLGTTGNPAALILNGGTISGNTLAAATASEFVIYTSGTSAISSAITTSTSGMSVFGPGTLDFSSSVGNTFTGGLRINNSTVIASADNQLGGSTAAITLTGGTLQTSGTFALGGAAQRAITLAQTGGTFNVSSGTTTYQNGSTKILTGSGSLTKIGSGTLELTGSITNTYTGGTFANVGTLQLGASNMLADTGAVTVNGGTLALGTNTDTVGAVTLTSGSITGTGGTLTGASYAVESGSVSANLGGAGIALTKSTAGTVTLSGTNTYTGTTTVGAGTLTLGHATDTLSSSSAVTVNGATAVLALGTNTDTVGAVTLTSGSITGTGTGRLTGTSYDVQSGTISAKLGGSGALTKTTAGTVTISSDNSDGGYTGAMSVLAGKLLIHGSTSASSNFTVNNLATLGGSGTIGGSVTLMSGATLSPGASIESLGTGSNIWNGGSTVQVEFSTDGSTGAAGTQWDLLSITGTLDLTGASSGSPITLDLVSMLNATDPGLLAIWNKDANATWAGFVTTTGGITGFAADKFAFDTTQFLNTLNGTFSVSQNGNNLDLNYMTNYVIPEPRAAMLGGIGLLLLLRRRR